MLARVSLFRHMDLDYGLDHLLPPQWIDLSVFAHSDVATLDLICDGETSAACGQPYEATFLPTVSASDRRFHSFSLVLRLSSPPLREGVARVIVTVYNALSLGHQQQVTVMAETEAPLPPLVTLVQRRPDPAAFTGDHNGTLCAALEQFIRVQWRPVTSLSLIRYEIAVGSHSNATSVLPFTSVGRSTSASLDGLLPPHLIVPGAKLFVSVRAVNGAGVGSAGLSPALTFFAGAPVALRAGFGSDPDVAVSYWTNTTRLQLYFEAFRQPAKEDLWMRYSVSSVRARPRRRVLAPPERWTSHASSSSLFVCSVCWLAWARLRAAVSFCRRSRCLLPGRCWIPRPCCPRTPLSSRPLRASAVRPSACADRHLRLTLVRWCWKSSDCRCRRMSMG